MNEDEKRGLNKINVFKMILLSLFILIPYIVCGILIYELVNINKDLNDIKTNILSEEVENIDDHTELNDINLEDLEFVEIEKYTRGYELEDLTDGEEYPDYQRIYLTFDDGPGKYTNDLLDILYEYNVKATFFVIYQPNCEALYQRIVADGHTLALHSYTHSYRKVYGNLEGFTNDVTSMYDFLFEVTGEYPKFYRFPGGSSNTIYKGDKNNLIDFIYEKDLVYYDWNCESKDASKTPLTSNQIANNVIKSVGNKKEAIVLMHDTNAKKSTIDAVPTIIEYFQEKDNVIFLPITESTEPIQHVKKK